MAGTLRVYLSSANAKKYVVRSYSHAFFNVPRQPLTKLSFPLAETPTALKPWGESCDDKFVWSQDLIPLTPAINAIRLITHNFIQPINYLCKLLWRYLAQLTTEALCGQNANLADF